MSKKFDLMPEKASNMFRVTFDLYTPRAHFIILPLEKFEESIKQYPELEKDTKLKLLESAKSIVSEYRLQNSAILSLHFGSWLSTKNKFHAHICVEVDDYLDIWKSHKEKIVFPPEQNRKKWSNGKDAKDYEENVRNYSPDTYSLKEVQDIEHYRKKPVKPDAPKITYPPSPFFLHPSEPRVGYIVENSKEPRDNESDLKALEAMFKYAKDKNLTEINAEGGDNGCHVCLVLDGKSHGKSILVNLP